MRWSVTLLALPLCAAVLQGAQVFTEGFSYSDGALTNVASTVWIQTGASVVNPIQVSSGRVSLTSTGQDANAALSATLTNIAGNSFYIGATLRVAAAQAAGDYFLHVSPTPGDTTAFFGRLFARSSGTGFQLGYLETSGAGGTTNFGSSVLALATDYRVVLAYSFQAGLLNDTAAVYVNPSSPIESENTAYLTDLWTSATAEPTVIGAINLRQGTASSAPTLVLDDLVVANTFNDALSFTPVPEPSVFLLGGLAALALVLRRRRS